MILGSNQPIINLINTELVTIPYIVSVTNNNSASAFLLPPPFHKGIQKVNCINQPAVTDSLMSE